MFEVLRKRLQPPAVEPCRHPFLAIDWYRDSGIGTCPVCSEVFLVGLDLAPLGDDWTAVAPVEDARGA